MHVALEYLKLKLYALLSFDNSCVSVPKIIILDRIFFLIAFMRCSIILSHSLEPPSSDAEI